MNCEEIEKFSGQKVRVKYHTEPLPGPRSQWLIDHIAFMKELNSDYEWEQPIVTTQGVLRFCSNGLVGFDNIQPPGEIYSGFNLLQRNVVSIQRLS
jgi:hypothetical protein